MTRFSSPAFKSFWACVCEILENIFLPRDTRVYTSTKQDLVIPAQELCFIRKHTLNNGT